jgi:hypothetical protein
MPNRASDRPRHLAHAVGYQVSNGIRFDSA